MDFAAWMEVYLGDQWWTFDPRNNERRKGRVLIGRGRDAGDVAMAATTSARPIWSRRSSPRTPRLARLQLTDHLVQLVDHRLVADRYRSPEHGQCLGCAHVDHDDLDHVARQVGAVGVT